MDVIVVLTKWTGMTNTSIGLMMLMILYFGGRQVVRDEMSAGQLMSYMVATQNVQKSFGIVAQDLS